MSSDPTNFGVEEPKRKLVSNKCTTNHGGVFHSGNLANRRCTSDTTSANREKELERVAS